MKKFFAILVSLLISLAIYAQNQNADSIIGKYSSVQNGDTYKVVVTKAADGSYTGKIYSANLKNGKPFNLPSGVEVELKGNDQIVLFSGLKYNKSKQCWDGTKIYDPQRKIRANMTASFSNSNSLNIKGSLMGISETVNWRKIK